jgi:hypothetical protein
VIPRNVLEWRLDPACESRDPGAPQLDDLVILVCERGLPIKPRRGGAAATRVRPGHRPHRRLSGLAGRRPPGTAIGDTAP